MKSKELVSTEIISNIKHQTSNRLCELQELKGGVAYER
jgi:hypothetical protein